MSAELTEIRKALQDIRDIATRTATDVSWIKGGTEAQNTRLATAEKRISRVENRQHWLAGVYSAISAGLAVWGEHFFRGGNG